MTSKERSALECERSDWYTTGVEPTCILVLYNKAMVVSISRYSNSHSLVVESQGAHRFDSGRVLVASLRMEIVRKAPGKRAQTLCLAMDKNAE